jgi:hypothetical protein
MKCNPDAGPSRVRPLRARQQPGEHQGLLLRSNETGPMLEVDLVVNKRIRAKQKKKIAPF